MQLNLYHIIYVSAIPNENVTVLDPLDIYVVAHDIVGANAVVEQVLGPERPFMVTKLINEGTVHLLDTVTSEPKRIHVETVRDISPRQEALAMRNGEV